MEKSNNFMLSVALRSAQAFARQRNVPSVMRVEQRGPKFANESAFLTESQKKRRLGPFAKYAIATTALHLAGVDMIPALLLAQPAVVQFEDALRRARDSALYRRIEETMQVYQHTRQAAPGEPFDVTPRPGPFARFATMLGTMKESFDRVLPSRVFIKPASEHPDMLAARTTEQSVPFVIWDESSMPRNRTQERRMVHGEVMEFKEVPMLAPSTGNSIAATPVAAPPPRLEALVSQNRIPMQPRSIQSPASPASPARFLEPVPAIAKAADVPSMPAAPVTTPIPVASPKRAMEDSALGRALLRMQEGEIDTDRLPVLHIERRTAAPVPVPMAAPVATPASQSQPEAVIPVTKQAQNPSNMGVFAKFALSGLVIAGLATSLTMTQDTHTTVLDHLQHEHALQKAESAVLSTTVGMTAGNALGESGKDNYAQWKAQRSAQPAVMPVSAKPATFTPDPAPMPGKKHGATTPTPKTLLQAVSIVDAYGIRMMPMKFQGKQMHAVHPADRVALAKDAAVRENLTKQLGPDAWKVVYGVITAESNWMPRDGMGANKRASFGIAQMEAPTARALKIDPSNPHEAAHGVAKLITEGTNAYQQRVRAGLVVRDEQGKALGKQEGLATYLSVHYNTSTDMRQKWDGSIAKLEVPTRQHISNLRYGMSEAASVERQIKAMTPEQHDKVIARQIGAEAMVASARMQAQKTGGDRLDATVQTGAQGNNIDLAKASVEQARKHADDAAALNANATRASMNAIEQARLDMQKKQDALNDHDKTARKSGVLNPHATRSTLARAVLVAQTTLKNTTQAEENKIAQSYANLVQAKILLYDAQATLEAKQSGVKTGDKATSVPMTNAPANASGLPHGHAPHKANNTHRDKLGAVMAPEGVPESRVAHLHDAVGELTEDKESDSPGMA